VPLETAKQKERNTMIFEKLVALIAEQFNVDEDSITMDTSFVDDLNADSVDLMDLSVALEEEFGIEEMGDEDVSSITTVGDVVHFLQSRLD
jgi:acyl carrier protein